MKSFFIFCLLLLIIKCENWYGEITGYDINNGKKYAGKRGITITHFYLCGGRSYWVHFKDGGWSKEFSNCDPVGTGVPIDAICIGGGKKYRARLRNGEWGPEITRCNILDNSDTTAFAGKIGFEIDSIAISGEGKYSVAVGDFSSNPEETAKRVVENLLGVKISFSKEDEIYRGTIGKIDFSVKLLKKYEISQDGDIVFSIENGEIKSLEWTNILGKNKIELSIEKITKVKPIEIKMTVESAFSKGMYNGKVTCTLDLITKDLIIDAMSKIDISRNIISGGFRITLHINDEIKKKFVLELSKNPYFLLKEEREKVVSSMSFNDNELLRFFDHLFGNRKEERITLSIKIGLILDLVFEVIKCLKFKICDL